MLDWQDALQDPDKDGLASTSRPSIYLARDRPAVLARTFELPAIHSPAFVGDTAPERQRREAHQGLRCRPRERPTPFRKPERRRFQRRQRAAVSPPRGQRRADGLREQIGGEADARWEEADDGTGSGASTTKAGGFVRIGKVRLTIGADLRVQIACTGQCTPDLCLFLPFQGILTHFACVEVY